MTTQQALAEYKEIKNSFQSASNKYASNPSGDNWLLLTGYAIELSQAAANVNIYAAKEGI